jgi:uncharacterized protein DUF4277
MDTVTVERLDHLGIIAGVIKDLGIIEMIDARIVPDDQEDITTGEAVAGMILNGLGFSDRPLSLTPQLFANKPRVHLRVAVQLSGVCVIFGDDGAAAADNALSWAMMSHARHSFIIALLSPIRAVRLRKVP